MENLDFFWNILDLEFLGRGSKLVYIYIFWNFFESYIPPTQEQKTSTMVPVFKKMKKHPIQAMPTIFEDENSNANITDQPKVLSKVLHFIITDTI